MADNDLGTFTITLVLEPVDISPMVVHLWVEDGRAWYQGPFGRDEIRWLTDTSGKRVSDRVMMQALRAWADDGIEYVFAKPDALLPVRG